MFLELRVRRLKWLRDILEHPGDNVQIRAALSGCLTTRATDIDEEYTPWLEQLAQNMEWCKRSSAGWHEFF